MVNETESLCSVRSACKYLGLLSGVLGVVIFGVILAFCCWKYLWSQLEGKAFSREENPNKECHFRPSKYVRRHRP